MMDKGNTNMTSLLLENLVDGVIDNDVDENDPIINYLVKNEGFNAGRDSDCDSRDLCSDDSDIEVLIEEHILLEKLKQVTGKQRLPESTFENESEQEIDLPTNLENNTTSEIVLMKTYIEEAMQINLKMREELLNVEKKIAQKYREVCEKKQEQMQEEKLAETRLKFQFPGPLEHFIDYFRAPYFKSEGSVAPINSDSERIIDTIIPYIDDNYDWTSANVASLCMAIRKFVILGKIEAHQRPSKANQKKKTEKFNHLKTISLYDLVKNKEDENLDWKVIASSISRPVSEKECQQMWSLLIKPSLKEWTPEEDSLLVYLAKSNHLQNWDKIAIELETGRSAFECFSHHQREFTVDGNDAKWTKDEERHLNHIIENTKIGTFISWDKVTYHMDTKYVEQIYAKWHSFQAPHLAKGSFTEQEDRILLGLIHKFGADIKSVATIMKNRSMAQLTSRYKDHLLPQLNLKVGEWTVAEDEKLLNLVKEHGETKWATVAKHFQTRSRTQIRHRYNLLKRKLSDNPNLNLNLIYRPKRPTSKKRITKNRVFFNKVISTKGRHIKSLLQRTEEVNKKRMKTIDEQLTQYFQKKRTTENINNTKFMERFENMQKSKDSFGGSDDFVNNMKKDETTSNPYQSSLLFSLIALRNLYEDIVTDNWSNKDRTTFYKNILELVTNKNSQEKLLKWHETFCSLFSAPAFLSSIDRDFWNSCVDK